MICRNIISITGVYIRTLRLLGRKITGLTRSRCTFCLFCVEITCCIRLIVYICRVYLRTTRLCCSGVAILAAFRCANLSIIFPTCCIGITGYPIAVQRRTRNTTVVLVALTAADTRCTRRCLGIYVIIRTRIACCISGTEQVHTSLTLSRIAIAATYRILLRVILVAGITVALYPVAVN